MPTCPMGCRCILHSTAYSTRPVCPANGCPPEDAQIGDLFVGSNYGEGFANTDGQALSQATYSELFSRVGIQPSFEGEIITTYPYKLEQIAYGNGIYVGVAQGNVYKSTDTYQWKLVQNVSIGTNQTSKIAYCSGLGLFVAGSSASRNLFTSTDGIVWKNVPIPSFSATNVPPVIACSPTTIVYAHNSTVSNVFTSTDGVEFIQRAVPSASYSALFYSPGNPGTPQFILGSSTGGLVTSPDGITWTSRTSNISSLINEIGYAPTGPTGVLVAVGNNGVITRSDTDGTTWQAATYQTGESLTGVVYNQNTGTWIASGGVVMTSLDASGISGTWTTAMSTMNGKANIFYGTKYVRCGLQGLLADSPDLTTWTSRVSRIVNNSQLAGAYGVGTTGQVYVVMGSSASSQYSLDGVNWNLAAIAPTQTQNHVVFWPTVNLFVSCGVGGTIHTSLNGINWSNVATTNLSGQTANAIAYNSSIMVVVAANGTIATSPDTVTWTARTANYGTSLLSGVAWNGTIFCAAGAGLGTLVNVITSSDGITWTRQTSNIASSAVSWITSDGVGMFYAIKSVTSYVWRSTDAITWTAYPCPLILQSIGWINGQLIAYSLSGNVAYSTNGQTWQMPLNNTGIHGPGSGTGIPGKAYYFSGISGVLLTSASSDDSGSIFRTIDNKIFSGLYSSQYTAIVYGNGKLVAVGTRLLISTSSDIGTTWHHNTSLATSESPNNTTFSTNFTAIAYSSSLGLFVAVTDNSVIYSSPDGDVWTQRIYTNTFITSVIAQDNGFVALNDVIWANGMFVAVGANGTIATSTDGITWSDHTVPSTGSLTSVCYNNSLGLFLTAGSSISFMTSVNGTSWAIQQSTMSSSIVAVESLEERGFVATTSGQSYYSADGINWQIYPGLASGKIVYSDVDKSAVFFNSPQFLVFSKGKTYVTQSIPQSIIGTSQAGIDYIESTDEYIGAGSNFTMIRARRTYDKNKEFVLPLVDGQSVKVI